MNLYDAKQKIIEILASVDDRDLPEGKLSDNRYAKYKDAPLAFLQFGGHGYGIGNGRGANHAAFAVDDLFSAEAATRMSKLDVLALLGDEASMDRSTDA